MENKLIERVEWHSKLHTPSLHQVGGGNESLMKVPAYATVPLHQINSVGGAQTLNNINLQSPTNNLSLWMESVTILTEVV